jgi:hypothetical protein
METSLPARFSTLKKSLITSELHGKALEKAWREVLTSLQKETQEVIASGSDLIPVVEYPGVEAMQGRKLEDWLDVATVKHIKKRGTVIVKGVIPKAEALQYKQDIRDYVVANPQTKGRSLWMAGGGRRSCYATFG